MATIFITKYLPEGARVREDGRNGRWNIMYPRRPTWSISWTDRGVSAAVDMCLLTAWEFHGTAVETRPRWDLGDLAARVTDADASLPTV